MNPFMKFLYVLAVMFVITVVGWGFILFFPISFFLMLMLGLTVIVWNNTNK